jgi:hypothetical protein
MLQVGKIRIEEEEESNCGNRNLCHNLLCLLARIIKAKYNFREIVASLCASVSETSTDKYDAVVEEELQ